LSDGRRLKIDVRSSPFLAGERSSSPRLSLGAHILSRCVPSGGGNDVAGGSIDMALIFATEAGVLLADSA
jgi:hypothetical protein